MFPNNYDTLKVLGSLYAHSDPADQKEKETRRQKAKEILKKVVDMCPDDIEALIDYAQLIENINPQVILLCIRVITCAFNMLIGLVFTSFYFRYLLKLRDR